MKETGLFGTVVSGFLTWIGHIYGVLADDRMGHFLSSLASLGSISVAVATVTILGVKYRRSRQ